MISQSSISFFLSYGEELAPCLLVSSHFLLRSAASLALLFVARFPTPTPNPLGSIGGVCLRVLSTSFSCHSVFLLTLFSWRRESRLAGVREGEGGGRKGGKKGGGKDGESRKGKRGTREGIQRCRDGLGIPRSCPLLVLLWTFVESGDGGA